MTKPPARPSRPSGRALSKTPRKAGGAAKPQPNPQSATSASSPDGTRIAKVLARAGVASRRGAEAIIEAGRVRVNGEKIDSPALNVKPSDKILVDGEPLAAAEPIRVWLYNKPLGLVTSERDEKGRETVFDALPEGMPRVMSVGRLDLNSEGLLLLTNDGELKRRLELPSTGWLRKYRVRVRGTPTPAMLEPVKKGVTIDGERFQPMLVTIDRQQGANAWLTVGIREGRNREVRRVLESVGLFVNRLIRIAYGPFQLGELATGEVEELRPKVLRDQLGLSSDEVASGRAAPLANTSDDKGAAFKTGGRSAKGKPRGTPRRAQSGDELDTKPARKSWGSKSHGGSRAQSPSPERGGANARGGGKTLRSWGQKSAQSTARPQPGKPKPSR